MDRAEIEDRRREVIQKWGPWTKNIRLAEGMYTMGSDLLGAAERRVASVTQIVTDLRGGSLAGTRLLDLACHEGGFGVEMASRGAHVVCVEARDAHIAKLTFVKECLGLDRLEIVQDDVRSIDVSRLGAFDVVLCLGLLYHLPAHDLTAFVGTLAQLCADFCVVETQISMSPQRSFEADGRRYSGRLYPEDKRQPGAAIDGQDSFWLTRPSLLNILSAGGFSSIVQLLNPPVLEVAAFEDHVTLVAFRGQRIEPRSTLADAGRVFAWPERLSRRRHPVQSRLARWPFLRRYAYRRLTRVIRDKDAPAGR